MVEPLSAPDRATDVPGALAGSAQTVLLVGFAAALAWAPFWLGGNRPLAWGVNGVVFPGLALAYEALALLQRRPHPVALTRIAGPVALFALATAWALLQSAPLGVGHPLWEVAAQALGRPLTGAISLNPGETRLAALRLLTDASAFWLALQLCRRPERAHGLLAIVAGVTALYGAFGLALAPDGVNPFVETPPAPGAARATFVNRNHFATYAGLGVVVCAGLALRAFKRAWSEAGRAHRSGFAAASAWRGWVALGFGVVSLAALLETGSRGGALATAAGLAGLLGLLLARGNRGAAIGALLALGLVIALGAGLDLIPDRLLARLAEAGLGGEGRLPADVIVARAILDHPLTGLGYGAFADAFPIYRDQSLPSVGVWDKAHNTYLETLLGLGVIFGTALIASLVWLVGLCLAGALRRKRDATAPLVAVAASLVVGAHALVDFSLQIEAVAITYLAILGAGVAQCASGRSAIGDGDRMREKHLQC